MTTLLLCAALSLIGIRGMISAVQFERMSRRLDALEAKKRKP